jgi:hypothetical protein
MPQKTRTLTMNRQGEFQILTTGDSHCGTFTNRKLDIRYHMICECESTLDPRGFLFEQVNVDNFFKQMKRTSLSCEKLTIACCTRLVSMIRRDNPSCRIRSIELKLSPFPYAASMTYSVKSPHT